MQINLNLLKRVSSLKTASRKQICNYMAAILKNRYDVIILPYS